VIGGARCVAGLDVGSTTTSVVLLEPAGRWDSDADVLDERVQSEPGLGRGVIVPHRGVGWHGGEGAGGSGIDESRSRELDAGHAERRDRTKNNRAPQRAGHADRGGGGDQ
jgi:hypothetical protein